MLCYLFSSFSNNVMDYSILIVRLETDKYDVILKLIKVCTLSSDSRRAILSILKMQFQQVCLLNICISGIRNGSHNLAIKFTI